MRTLLETIEGVEIVAEAGDGREAAELAVEHRPDILIMDIAMAGLNGLEAAEQIIRERPESRVIILSMHSTIEYVERALRIGVKGYVIKDAAVPELEIAIRAVARGENYLSPVVASKLMAHYGDQRPWEIAETDRLTPREREVLQLIAEGHSSKAIAIRLKVSAKTVETHRANLMKQLGVHEVTGLVRYAVRMGLVSADE